MKSVVSLILTFLLCSIGSAQHISDFTSLDPTGQNTDFDLPNSHTFQYIIQHGDPLDVGGTMPDVLDFTAYVPREGSSKYGYLSINSEDVPGAVTILDIEFDDEQGKWMVDHSEPVHFDFGLLFAQTAANCSGVVTPWNTIISCEEVTNKDIQVKYPLVADSWIKVDGDLNSYDGYGWAIEIDPATRTVLDQDDSRDGQDKLWAMGNFKHENAVIHENLRTVYQGADDWQYDEGFLFKFVADREKDLSSGLLYVYKETSSSGGDWILIPNTTIAERNATLANCLAVGATSFDGIEDVDINPIDGTVHFAVKGDGRVYHFTDSDPITGTTVSNFKTYVGGMSYEIKPGVSEPWGTGNDNLVFDDLGNLWVAQDGDDHYIWVVENGHTQANPKVKIFGRTPAGSEPTGLTFTPDYKYIFMSIQHPSSSNSATTQTDALGRSVAFDQDVAIVLARNEHLGKDLTQEDQDLMITQYYEDEASDSKWVEVKNVSGQNIAAGTYFLDLFDNTLLDNIASVSPKASQAIPDMAVDEVILFKNSLNPMYPEQAHLGNAEQIYSPICDFDGDDVLLISTTPGSRKYRNRKDIIGSVPAADWGSNVSFVKGATSPSVPQRTFEQDHWFEIRDLDEVKTAKNTQNMALGTFVMGDAKWDGSSWEGNSTPDRTRIVEIEGVFNEADQDLQVYDLRINNGGTLNFQNDSDGKNHTLAIYRNLRVESGASLVIGDTESLIIKNSEALVNGNITKIEKSMTRSHVNDITYWSSPVDGEQIESVFEKVDPNRIFYYDQSKFVSPETYWDVWVNQSSGPMIPGKGYAAEGEAQTTGIHEINFQGKPNYGIISVEDIVFNNDLGNNEDLDNDFNLIGNPYPAAIDIESFLDRNTQVNGVIDGTLYLWTHATANENGFFTQNDYVTYNYVGAAGVNDNVAVNGTIGSAQGFFVRAIKAEDILFEPEMMLERANDQFFKRSIDKNEEEKDRIWINLKDSRDNHKQILIGFDERASDGFDIGYDALYLKGGQEVDFYSILNGDRLTIQGLGASLNEKSVNIGFETQTEDMKVTLELGRIEGSLRDKEVFLVDHSNGKIHDLHVSEYSFSVERKGVYNDRFSLLFNSSLLSNEDPESDDEFKVFLSSGRLIIDTKKFIQQLKIYDSLGRLVAQKKPASSYYELNLDHLAKGGFYIVELIDDQGSSYRKKVLLY